MSGTRAFVDTNVFLYVHARAHPEKQARAKGLIDDLQGRDCLLLSTQVVQEFYSIGSRKLKLDASLLRQAVSDLLDLPLVVNGHQEIRSALSNEARYRISFWDALILAAAESGGADVVYSEDLNHTQQYGSLTVINPFRFELNGSKARA